jgi:hypothetical protein
LQATDFVQATDLVPIDFVRYYYFHSDWYHTYDSVKHYSFRDSNSGSCLEFVAVSILIEHFVLEKNCVGLVIYDGPISLKLLEQPLAGQFTKIS